MALEALRRFAFSRHSARSTQGATNPRVNLRHTPRQKILSTTSIRCAVFITHLRDVVPFVFVLCPTKRTMVFSRQWGHAVPVNSVLLRHSDMNHGDWLSAATCCAWFVSKWCTSVVLSSNHTDCFCRVCLRRTICPGGGGGKLSDFRPGVVAVGNRGSSVALHGRGCATPKAAVAGRRAACKRRRCCGRCSCGRRCNGSRCRLTYPSKTSCLRPASKANWKLSPTSERQHPSVRPAVQRPLWAEYPRDSCS